MRSNPKQWKKDFRQNGYLVVEDVVDPETLEALRTGVDDITSDPDALSPYLRHYVQMERDYVRQQPEYNELNSDQLGNAVRNIMELPLFDPRFADFIVFPPVLDVLEALFESTEFHFHNYKCIVKAAHVSSALRWHRDLPYLEHSTPNLITAMVCLDPMTVENGATVVLPGSHRIPHEAVLPQDAEIKEAALPGDFERVTVTCPAGSLVAFDVSIIHGGGQNRSPAPRRNVVGIWSGPDTYPVTGARYVYHGLYPRSQDPARQQQVQLSFPHLFDAPSRAKLDFSHTANAPAGDIEAIKSDQLDG